MGNKELASVAIGSGISHRQDAGAIMLEIGMELILELVPRAARSGSLGTTALDHEVGDHSVKRHVVIELFAAQLLKVIDGFWCLIREQFDADGSFTGLKNSNFHDL